MTTKTELRPTWGRRQMPLMPDVGTPAVPPGETILVSSMVAELCGKMPSSKRLQGQGIADQRREIARGLEESVEVLNKVGINSQEASALIVVTQHYDTLQAIGGETNSNLILLPNSPQAGSNMLNDMVASFTASNQIDEAMKEKKNKPNTDA